MNYLTILSSPKIAIQVSASCPFRTIIARSPDDFIFFINADDVEAIWINISDSFPLNRGNVAGNNENLLVKIL